MHKTFTTTILVLILFVVPGFGQESSNDEDVYELSPFEVSTSGDTNAYLATEATTGTRVAAKIQDLPFAVNVVTSEFMDDFAAFELEEQFAYTSSFSADEGQGNYSIRGIKAFGMLRNGFMRAGLIDKVNVDRVEVIKGPAAAIYGRTLPGGIINFITRKPETERRVQGRFRVGGYNFKRAQLSATGPLNAEKSFLYRLDYGYIYDEQVMDLAFIEQTVGSGALAWRPSKKTTLNLEVEYANRDERNGNAKIPWIWDDVNKRYTDQPAFELRGFATQGPETFLNRDLMTYNISFDHRFNRIFSLRASANHYERTIDRYNYSADRYVPELRQIITREAGIRDQGDKSTGAQIDFLSNFWTGKIEHKILLTYDYSRMETTDVTKFIDRNDPEYGRPWRELNVDNPEYAPRFPEELFTRSRRDTFSDIVTNGLFASEQIAFWEGKWIILVGGRFDQVDYDLRDNRSGNTNQYSVDDTTYMVGSNFELTEDLTIYANRSTSFLPQNRLRNDGTPFPNEDGKGYEFGIKSTLFENRLNFTTGYFNIVRENVVRRHPDPRIGGYVLTGQESTEGFELDFNFTISERLTLTGGYGYLVARFTNTPDDPGLEGLPLPRAPRHQGGIAARYQFRDGPLKGLRIVGGIEHFGKILVDIGNPMDDRRDYRQDAYTTLDLGFSYDWQTHERSLAHNVRINLKNVTDEKYYWSNRKPADEFQLIVMYGITWR
mgnify:CR=1 FL=1